MSNTRREIIREMLSEKPFISLKELGDRFPALSSMTLRRDIEYFEKQGECIKVRGGARSMKFITTSMEESFNLRLHANSAAKECIARQAAAMIEPGRSIFLDSGTTVLKLVSILEDERLTITTSGPNVAMELLKKNMPIVNIVGGMINRDNISVSGTQAMRYMEDINIDIAFLTPSGLTSETGFTCGNYSECEFKQQIIKKARMVVLLMDNSKIDKSLPYTFARMGDIDAVITNREFPPEIMKLAKDTGTKIIIAKPE
ncbi:MAG: DeoR/GlpR family DNA-binding transcription regulator [Clostridia bacterium]|nr:DeoR/GlpR family DNA-binding transcription regulator [Clostridia bacterium]